jgi:hypothetical protein
MRILWIASLPFEQAVASRDASRKTEAQMESLPPCRTLSFPTVCRLIPALHDYPVIVKVVQLGPAARETS